MDEELPSHVVSEIYIYNIFSQSCNFFIYYFLLFSRVIAVVMDRKPVIYVKQLLSVIQVMGSPKTIEIFELFTSRVYNLRNQSRKS